MLKKHFGFFALIGLFVTGGASQTHAYYMKDGTQAHMVYETEFEFTPNLQFPLEDNIQDALSLHIKHLAGPMSEATPRSSPRRDHEPKTKILHSETRGDKVSIRYRYEGTIVIGAGNINNYHVTLPVNPQLIYDQGTVSSGKSDAEKHPCTHPLYPEKEYFWYFWNPGFGGCPLKEGVHYRKVPVQLTPIANTQSTYPEYERLVNNNGNLPIYLFISPDNFETGADPESNDYNAPNFRKIRDWFKQNGFSVRRWQDSEMHAICPFTNAYVPFILQLEKVTPRGRVQVIMSYGSMDLLPYGLNNHCLYSKALAEASMVFYLGHSGLGETLSLQNLRDVTLMPMKPAPNQYQIYAFNGCSSYAYYNLSYLQEKPAGSRHLDIVTNGKSPDFYELGDTSLILIGAVIDWVERGVRTSYQDILNRYPSTGLSGVNGDEDNPKN